MMIVCDACVEYVDSSLMKLSIECMSLDAGGRYHVHSNIGPDVVCRICHVRSQVVELCMYASWWWMEVCANNVMPPLREPRSRREMSW